MCMNFLNLEYQIINEFNRRYLVIFFRKKKKIKTRFSCRFLVSVRKEAEFN